MMMHFLFLFLCFSGYANPAPAFPSAWENCRQDCTKSVHPSGVHLNLEGKVIPLELAKIQAAINWEKVVIAEEADSVLVSGRESGGVPFNWSMIWVLESNQWKLLAFSQSGFLFDSPQMKKYTFLISLLFLLGACSGFLFFRSRMRS